VLLTTHEMDEAERLSDRVCIIDGGKILVSGRVEEIKRQLKRSDLIEIETSGGSVERILSRLTMPISHLSLVGNGSATFSTEDSAATAREILGAAAELGIGIERLSVRRVNLEDIFIGLTGRGLRE
jgi:ABC-2 type transport system ATP-binding protein